MSVKDHQFEEDIIINNIMFHFEQKHNEQPSYDDIEDMVDYSLKNPTNKFDHDMKLMINKIMDKFTISHDEQANVVEKKYEWRKKFIESEGFRYKHWGIHKRFLKQSGFPKNSIEAIDKLTDDVLDSMGDPNNRAMPFLTKNLVVGDIQSGKTTTYLALANKAYDLGYSTVIIIAGRFDDLRIQTNLEADRMIVGRNTNESFPLPWIGVGKLANQPDGRKLFPRQQGRNFELVRNYTSATNNGDFNGSDMKQFNRGLNILDEQEVKKLAVIKKHPSSLGNVIKALKYQGAFSSNNPNNSGSILIIDDETDDASMNTNQRDEYVEDSNSPTTTNRLIREILRISSRCSYVGFTATPYAPSLIPIEGEIELANFGEDLYPNDGIFLMPRSDNYFGASKMYGFTFDQDGNELEHPDGYFPGIKKIDEAEIEEWWPSNRNSSFPNEFLPKSMKEAIKKFFIASCIREDRNISDFNTMLIHVNYRNFPNEEIVELIKKEINRLEEKFQSSQDNWKQIYENFINDSNEIIKYLNNKDFSKSKYKFKPNPDTEGKYPNWDELKILVFNLIKEVSSHIKKYDNGDSDIRPVLPVNSNDASNKLPYSEMQTNQFPEKLSERFVIAVGGFILSRGMVLKGLTISYYLRSAQEQKADTIQQMARWFGYRNGYEDLLRVFTSNELIIDHQDACEMLERYRKEIRDTYQKDKATNSRTTPKEIAIKVKSSNNNLSRVIATSRNKSLGSVDYSMNLNNNFTTSLNFGLKDVEANFNALENLLNNLGHHTDERELEKTISGYCWNNVDPAHILEFFNPRNDNYKGPHNMTGSGNQHIVNQFIKEHNSNKELINWTVGVLSNQQIDNLGNGSHEKVGNYSIIPISRKLKNYNEKVGSYGGVFSFKSVAIGDWGFFDTLKSKIDIEEKVKYYRSIDPPNLNSAIRRRLERKKEDGLILFFLINPRNLNEHYSGELKKPLVGFVIETPNLKDINHDYKVRGGLELNSPDGILQEYVNWYERLN